MTDTVLEITGADLVPYSSRGATMTLAPIEQSKSTKRTINGELVDLALPQFQKYRATISCTDNNSPQFDRNWPGKSLTVKASAELSYKTAGGSPGRTVVTDSSHAEGDYTFYRPQLTMRVLSWDISYDEWGAEVGWNMELEEI